MSSESMYRHESGALWSCATSWVVCWKAIAFSILPPCSHLMWPGCRLKCGMTTMNELSKNHLFLFFVHLICPNLWSPDVFATDALDAAASQVRVSELAAVVVFLAAECSLNWSYFAPYRFRLFSHLFEV